MSVIVIGLDEAGYGPNLGPLVVAATAWRIDVDSDIFVKSSRKSARSVSRDKVAVASSMTGANVPSAHRATTPNTTVSNTTLSNTTVSYTTVRSSKSKRAECSIIECLELLVKRLSPAFRASPLTAADFLQEISEASGEQNEDDSLEEVELNKRYANSLHSSFPLRAQLSSNFRRFPLGDSKQIHQGKYAKHSLSVGLEYWFDRLGHSVDEVAKVLGGMAQLDLERLQTIPWYSGLWSDRKSYDRYSNECSIPNDGSKSPKTTSKSSFLKRSIKATQLIDDVGMELLDMQMRVVDEHRFNAGLEEHFSKGRLLSLTTLSLSKTFIDSIFTAMSVDRNQSVSEAWLLLDKHGGRNTYAGLLMEIFEGRLFTVVCESATLSVYRTEWNETCLNIVFLPRGDRLPPIALASMLAKWTRETCMLHLNEFWQARCSGLRETAGYPGDARRFAEEISDAAKEAGFCQSQWWRNR